mmetsp:Transcript_7033/g.7942  ORF Transcript_7033/g.7942 Transcript_7033/m.7942 type:complete len:82 (+) Transcript_7033:87-332(+)
MLRVSSRRLSFGHEAFSRMVQHIKKRDPNERHLRAGHIFLEVMKRFHAYVVALIFVVSATSYNQLYGSVRTPVQDGRSLVT